MDIVGFEPTTDALPNKKYILKTDLLPVISPCYTYLHSKKKSIFL